MENNALTENVNMLNKVVIYRQSVGFETFSIIFAFQE